jgi:hypothetical protein
MEHAQIKQAIADMAAMNAVLSPEEAVAQVASMIDRLEPRSESYEKDVAVLLSLGATILRQVKVG